MLPLLTTSVDQTPQEFVSKLLVVTKDIIQHVNTARRNQETLQLTKDLVESLAECLEVLELVPSGSFSLMVALHRVGHLLQTAMEFVVKYGGENRMRQLLFADKWALQVDTLHMGMLEARRDFVTALGHTLDLLGEEVEEETQITVQSLIKRVEERDDADQEAHLAWRTSPYVHPQAGPGKSGKMEVVTRNLRDAFDKWHEDDTSVLVLAARGDWAAVTQHLSSNPHDARVHGPVYSLLHLAVLWESTYAVALLLRFGADVDCRTGDYDPDLYLPKHSGPLHIAVEMGNESLCRLLICWGADRDLEDDWGRRPVNVETSEEVREILNDRSLRETARYAADQARELHFGYLLGLIEALHPVPMDIRATPSSDYFLLHHAARSGNPYVYHLLIANGASPLLRTCKSDLLPSEVIQAEPSLADARSDFEECEDRARQQLEQSWTPP